MKYDILSPLILATKKRWREGRLMCGKAGGLLVDHVAQNTLKENPQIFIICLSFKNHQNIIILLLKNGQLGASIEGNVRGTGNPKMGKLFNNLFIYLDKCEKSFP
jgi:hypothetical protein